MTIAGHHGHIDQPGTLSQKIEGRIKNDQELLREISAYAEKLPPTPNIKFPEMTHTQRELFIRMVFSSLVDSDYLDTEKHFNKRLYLLRKNNTKIWIMQ